eukprot:GHVU01181757.1.p1 GENE.GHVU01181757.1~~GHVU01181757.1.p1  ORF type:complete len:358 (+),score=10.95 GHVU01181757.1:214-1287(+)
MERDRSEYDGSVGSRPSVVGELLKAERRKSKSVFETPDYQVEDEEEEYDYETQREYYRNFTDTIRHMTYRTFARWYRGANAKNYRPHSIVSWCFTIAFIELVYYRACQVAWEDTTKIVLSLTSASVHLVFLLITPHHFVLVSQLVISCIYLVTTFIATIVVAASRGTNWTAGPLTGLFGQPCFKEGHYTPNWFVASYYCVGYLLMVLSIVHLTLVPLLGRWYILQSPCYLDRYQFSYARKVLFVVPEDEIADANHKDKVEHLHRKGVLIEFYSKRDFLNSCLSWISCKRLACCSRNLDSGKLEIGCYCETTESRDLCIYVGEIDDRGRPQGFGYWRQNSYHGEALSGYWENGICAAR